MTKIVEFTDPKSKSKAVVRHTFSTGEEVVEETIDFILDRPRITTLRPDDYTREIDITDEVSDCLTCVV